MGVISNNRTALPTVTFRDDFFPAEYLIESPDSTDDEAEDGHQQHHHHQENDGSAVLPRRRRSRFYGQLKLPHVKQYGLSAKSRLGARKMRRVENNKLLMSMTDVEDICEDLSDLLPDTTNAFSQLFVESDKMKIWNEFILKSEEEQRKILKNGFKKFRASESMSEGSGDNKKSNEASSTSKKTAAFDGRMGNPAFYSTNHRYHKIDKSLRFLLAHKESSWGKLRDAESNLTEFFKQDPKGTWTGCLESSFDRLLLHAVSQYLFLRACSFDAGGQRKTKVTNKYKFFVVPQENLFTYLKKAVCQSS